MAARSMGGVDTSFVFTNISSGPRRFNNFTTPFVPVERFYKFRGWYSAGSVYETWISTHSNAPPPSGHSLSDTILVGTWEVAGRTY